MTHTLHLADLRSQHIARGVGHATSIYAKSAKNADVWDVDGKHYIDFAGGIAVLNTGHCHPKVNAYAKAQIDQLCHSAFQVAPYEPYVALAAKINALAPIEGQAKSVFFTTGAEAVENAVKMARAHTKRDNILAFSGGFHGRTALTSALTGKVSPYKKGLGPALAGIYHLPFPSEALGVGEKDSLKMLDLILKADIAADTVAAIILEPVQGEGGFHITPKPFMHRLREICDQNGIVLIVDEVQSGFGRTGKIFAIEHYDIRPDLITMAKSLAGGFPLSGVVGKAAIIDAPEVGGLGGTYGGNPIACAAALGVLEVIDEEGLLAAADAQGALLTDFLHRLSLRNDGVPIRHIRALGAMVAFDLVTPDSHAPDAAMAKKLTQAAQAHGLILLSCGVYGNTIRLLCPLTASIETIREGLSRLEKAFMSL